MATETMNPAASLKKVRINRFDSPWFNPRFLTGSAMILIVILAGLLGPLFWDTKLSLVASSPLNLPPMWVRSANAPAEETVAEDTAAPTPVVQPTPIIASGFGSGGLGGSGLSSLMTTPSAPATPSPDQPAPSTTGRPAFIQRVTAPSGDPAHPLGTDNSGRDILAVLLVGAPASLRVGVIAAFVGILLGIILGFSAGFLGGWVDNVIRTAADVWLTIPSLAVLLVISAYMRRVDLDTMALLLALFAWPGPTRLLRAQVLSMRERGYVRMARLSGQSTFSIMFKEILPNLLPYLAASFAGNVSGAILAATSLEALGLGPTRYPTLGTTIFNALKSSAILRGMWWWWGFPVLTLMFIFSALFLIAVGLDEIANPRLRGAQEKR
jgi:peptide/nickel transport system permease protein